MQKIDLIRTCIAIAAFVFYADNECFAGGEDKIQMIVRNKVSGEPITNVNISIAGTPYGVSTDKYGFAELSGLSKGIYIVRFSHVGYGTIEREIATQGPEESVVEIFLVQVAIPMKIVDVIGIYNRDALAEGLEMREISSTEIKQIPSIGEKDVFTAIGNQAGVHRIGETSGDLVVRGGYPHDNKVMFDGITLHMPLHLGAFLGTINPDIIGSVSVYTGALPARYDDRISSVFSIKTRSRNNSGFGIMGSVSMLSSKVFISGSNDIQAWGISARRTYLDLIARSFNEEFGYNFSDIAIMSDYTLSQRNSLHLRYLWTKDNLTVYETQPPENGDHIEPGWGNQLLGARWNLLLSDSARLKTGVYYSTAKVESNTKKIIADNEIADKKFEQQLQVSLSPTHSFEAGYSINDLRLDHYWFLSSTNLDEKMRSDLFFDDAPEMYENRTKGRFIAAYIQDVRQISRSFLVNYGLNLKHSSFGNYTRISPRMTVRLRVFDNTDLFGSYARQYQYVGSAKIEGFAFTSLFNTKFSVDEDTKPIESDLMVVGYDLGRFDGFSVSISGYNRWTRNMFRIADDSNNDLVPYSGWSRGMESSLEKNGSKVNLDLNYTYGISRINIDGLELPHRFDITHQVNLTAFTLLTERLKFSANYVYRSGLPYTPKVGYYIGAVEYPFQSIQSKHYRWLGHFPIYGSINSARLPAYSRVDIQLESSFYTGSWNIMPYITIINILNRRNIIGYEGQAPPPYGTEIKMYPIIPTIGIGFGR